MKDSVFREIPPESSVLEWLAKLQIHGFRDTHSLTEKSFLFDGFNEILLEIEPYYYPCKAKIYLHREINMKRAITVLRQIVKPFGYTFLTHERLVAGEKYNEYYLGPETFIPAEPLKVGTIDFH